MTKTIHDDCAGAAHLNQLYEIDSLKGRGRAHMADRFERPARDQNKWSYHFLDLMIYDRRSPIITSNKNYARLNGVKTIIYKKYYVLVQA